MTITVAATYENGILNPKQPLPLQEGEEVQVTVNSARESTPATQRPAADEGYDPLEQVIGICDDGPPISLAARHDELVYGLKLDEES